MHQWDLVLAAEVDELDILNFVVEVDALAGGIHATVGGTQVVVKVLRKIGLGILDLLNGNHPREKIKINKKSECLKFKSESRLHTWQPARAMGTR